MNSIKSKKKDFKRNVRDAFQRKPKKAHRTKKNEKRATGMSGRAGSAKKRGEGGGLLLDRRGGKQKTEKSGTVKMEGTLFKKKTRNREGGENSVKPEGEKASGRELKVVANREKKSGGKVWGGKKKKNGGGGRTPSSRSVSWK